MSTLRRSFLFSSLLLLVPLAAGAQTDLEALWPNTDGLEWTYDGHYLESLPVPTETDFVASLRFEGTQTIGGEVVQNLVGHVDGMRARPGLAPPAGLDPMLARLWRWRPDLRPALTVRAARALEFWPFLLLHPADLNIGFLETADAIGDWRDEIAARSWLYVVDPITVGNTFSIQLVPDLATDVFLHGTIADADVTVSVGPRTFAHAWVVDYRIDLGLGTFTDEFGEVLGTARNEILGSVTFVAGVGPVAMDERTEVIEADCPPCGFEAGDVLQEGTLVLRDAAIPVLSASWSEIKSRY